MQERFVSVYILVHIFIYKIYNLCHLQYNDQIQKIAKKKRIMQIYTYVHIGNDTKNREDNFCLILVRPRIVL